MSIRELFLHDIAFALGGQRAQLDASAAAGRLRSRVRDLRTAGFHQHHLSPPEQSAYDLALAAVAPLGEKATTVDGLFYATCLPVNGNVGSVGSAAAYADSRDVKALMDFPASRLQAALGLDRAFVVGINQQACTGLLGCIRLACAMLSAESEDAFVSALCLTADRFPAGALYEQAYNLISDGAAACIVSRTARGFRVCACHGLTNGGLGQASDDETVGSFFSFGVRVVAETLRKAGLSPAQIDWIVPQNTHARAWPALARLTGLGGARIFDTSRAEVGHVISGDNLINLSALAQSGAARPGQRVLLFAAGYGLTFQSIVLEVV
jgi:3-oxoacyl-[acyl-carrier-protein] synthase-3